MTMMEKEIKNIQKKKNYLWLRLISFFSTQISRLAKSKENSQSVVSLAFESCMNAAFVFSVEKGGFQAFSCATNTAKTARVNKGQVDRESARKKKSQFFAKTSFVIETLAWLVLTLN